MAADKASLEALEPTLKDIVREDKGDCTACRAIGSVAFIGLAGYTYISGMSQLEKRRAEIARAPTRWGIGARKLGVQATSAGLFGLGLYRWFWS